MCCRHWSTCSLYRIYPLILTIEFREKRNLKPANNMKSYLITILIGWNKRYNLFLDHPSASYMLVYISSHAWPGRNSHQPGLRTLVSDMPVTICIQSSQKLYAWHDSKRLFRQHKVERQTHMLLYLHKLEINSFIGWHPIKGKQIQIRRRMLWRLIRIYIVCIKYRNFYKNMVIMKTNRTSLLLEKDLSKELR